MRVPGVRFAGARLAEGNNPGVWIEGRVLLAGALGCVCVVSALHPVRSWVLAVVRGLVNSSFPSLRRRCCDSARVPAIRPCLARSLPHLHGHMLTLRLHVPIQVRCRSRKALKNGRDRGKTHLGNLVDSTPPAGDLSRSSGGHGHERPATPGRPTVDPLCILDPLPAHF